MPQSERNFCKDTLPKSSLAKTVVFDHVEIRFYDQTIGDNPSTSSGPPITLDWRYDEEDIIKIDDYECGRPRRRNSAELHLSDHLRKGGSDARLWV